MEEKLKKIFNFSIFKDFQKEIITHSLDEYDIFAILQTGSGKSLCYQFLSLYLKGIILVISPLKSLIYDQIKYLQDKSIPVDKITGDQTDEEKKIIYKKCNTIPGLLLYTTPETLQYNVYFQDVLIELYKNNIFSRIVIDEAHCISSWGHDFRPSYLYLKKWRLQFPEIPISAFTSTAIPFVQHDIHYHLSLYSPKLISNSYFKSNLRLFVYPYSKDSLCDIKNWILKNYTNKTGIVYCHSKKTCIKISDYLNQNGLQSTYYYSGIKDRYNIQDKWKNNEIKIIVATIAFGMGIDKKDVRFIIHYNTSQSIENFYQEIGRGGRDGLLCDCRLYYSIRDKIIYDKMIQNKSMYWSKRRKILQMLFYSMNQVDCRHKQLCQYLGDSNLSACKNMCDNCILSLKKDRLECSEDICLIYKILKAYQSVGINIQKLTSHVYRKKKIYTDIPYQLVIERIIIWLMNNKYIECQYKTDINGVKEEILITDIFHVYINNVSDIYLAQIV